MTRWLLRAALGIVLVVVAVAAWFALQIDPIFSSAGRQVIVTVAPGSSFSTIAGELRAKGVIASPFALRLESLIVGTPIVRAGSYGFRQRSSFATVREILSARPNVVVAVPGLTLREIAQYVEGAKGAAYAQSFTAAATSRRTPSRFEHGSSLEGLIGADAYVITPTTTARELASEMVRGFEKEAASVGLTPTTTIDGLDAYQLIIAASIVEKEGYYPRNMPDVARVIFNRLARGGPLQMDSTVLYYLGRDGGVVTPAMLQLRTPYNTYLYSGLTPTPICTVSTTALKAVLHAPPGPWLYFTVIDKRGDEAFAATFAKQLQNEALARSRGVE